MDVYEKLTENQKHLMEQHLKLVMKANEVVNLTRIDTFDDGLVLHIEDSLSALKEVNDAPEGKLADMGSGAGFPGIPLAIATGRKTILIDARQKKMKLVESMIEEMGLNDQIEVFAGRAELLARKNVDAFAVITARALAKLSVLMELASPLLKQGGRLVCYKAHVDEEELEQAYRIESLVAMKHISDRSFILNGEYERRIIVFEKQGKPKIKLPRREGEAQNNPLHY